MGITKSYGYALLTWNVWVFHEDVARYETVIFTWNKIKMDLPAHSFIISGKT